MINSWQTDNGIIDRAFNFRRYNSDPNDDSILENNQMTREQHPSQVLLPPSPVLITTKYRKQPQLLQWNDNRILCIQHIKYISTIVNHHRNCESMRRDDFDIELMSRSTGGPRIAVIQEKTPIERETSMSRSTGGSRIAVIQEKTPIERERRRCETLVSTQTKIFNKSWY